MQSIYRRYGISRLDGISNLWEKIAQKTFTKIQLSIQIFHFKSIRRLLFFIRSIRMAYKMQTWRRCVNHTIAGRGPFMSLLQRVCFSFCGLLKELFLLVISSYFK